jgi:hypothetical protein
LHCVIVEEKQKDSHLQIYKNLYIKIVEENGEIWAKYIKICYMEKYRGESTRGTTNLRRHLQKYCAGKK